MLESHPDFFDQSELVMLVLMNYVMMTMAIMATAIIVVMAAVITAMRALTTAMMGTAVVIKLMATAI